MFYEWLVWAAKNPVPPMLMGCVLYIWIALGFMMLNEKWMGGMWFCYAIANIMLAGHTHYRIMNVK